MCSVKRDWGTAIPHTQAWESILWDSRMLNASTTHGTTHASSLQSGTVRRPALCVSSRPLSGVRLAAALISLSSHVLYGLYGAFLGMFTSSRRFYFLMCFGKTRATRATPLEPFLMFSTKPELWTGHLTRLWCRAHVKNWLQTAPGSCHTSRVPVHVSTGWKTTERWFMEEQSMKWKAGCVFPLFILPNIHMEDFKSLNLYFYSCHN